MRKIERLLLTFCYLFTLVAVVRMCVALVSGLELTFGNVVQVLFLFLGLGFLFFMAFSQAPSRMQESLYLSGT
jgi:hypothetical protein